MMTAAAHYTKPLLNSLAKYFLCSPHPSHLRINHSQIDAMIRLEKSSKKEEDLIKKSCFVSKMRELDFTQHKNLPVLEKDFLNFA